MKALERRKVSQQNKKQKGKMNNNKPNSCSPRGIIKRIKNELEEEHYNIESIVSYDQNM